MKLVHADTKLTSVIWRIHAPTRCFPSDKRRHWHWIYFFVCFRCDIKENWPAAIVRISLSSVSLLTQRLSNFKAGVTWEVSLLNFGGCTYVLSSFTIKLMRIDHILYWNKLENGTNFLLQYNNSDIIYSHPHYSSFSFFYRNDGWMMLWNFLLPTETVRNEIWKDLWVRERLNRNFSNFISKSY